MPKMSCDQVAKINRTQESIWSGITSQKNSIQKIECPLIKSLPTLSNEQVDSIGEIGIKLKKFISQVNLDHPEVTLNHPRWDEFQKDVISALSSPMKEELNTIYRNFARLLDRPKPRILRESDQRDKSRREKKHIKNIGMKNVYVQGENCLSNPDVDYYVCGSDLWQVEAKELETKGKHFDVLGMNEVAGVYKKRMASVEKFPQDSCLGFYPLKPEDAAVCLAKFHGYRWNAYQGVIIAPFKSFDEPFWKDEKIAEQTKYGDLHEMQQMEDAKKWITLKEKKVHISDCIGFNFQPRLYPLASFKLPMPQRVSEIITAVECHPLMNHFPIFDYYWVLVPGVSVQHPLIHCKSNSTWIVGDQTYKDQMEAAIALDYHLIKTGYLQPIVLAERDGKTFFLCLNV